MARLQKKTEGGRVGLQADVEQVAQGCLESCPYPGVKRLRCEFDGGSLTLRGRVGTFFEKQLAQERVAHLDGVRELVNVVEVG